MDNSNLILPRHQLCEISMVDVFVKLMQNKPVTKMFVKKFQLISFDFSLQVFFNVLQPVKDDFLTVWILEIRFKFDFESKISIKVVSSISDDKVNMCVSEIIFDDNENVQIMKILLLDMLKK